MNTSTESKLDKSSNGRLVDARRGITLVPRSAHSQAAPVFKIAVRNDVFESSESRRSAETAASLPVSDDSRTIDASDRKLVRAGTVIGLVAVAGLALGYFLGRNGLGKRD